MSPSPVRPSRTHSTTTRLYGPSGVPRPDFNVVIKGWLEGEIAVSEHSKTAAFDGVRQAYCEAIAAAARSGLSQRDSHRLALSNLTTMLFGHDLAAELRLRLSAEAVNLGGFRTTLAQGIAKNIGENFVNVIVYALADLLSNQDSILVDKGLPPSLKKTLTLKRVVPLKTGDKEVRIPIEGDFTIFSRDDSSKAIVISAKTRLKEVFHIGTMWKILFDMLGDPYCLQKWGLTKGDEVSVADILYVFATADMVASGSRGTQGPDVERNEPRNLIAMDASFFDYVFVRGGSGKLNTGIGGGSRLVWPKMA